MKAFPVKKIMIGNIPISDFVIVSGSTENEAESAQLLSDIVDRACGTRLAVVDSSEQPSNHEIVVGITNRSNDVVESYRKELKNDGVLFLCLNGKLFLQSASDLGVHYAVAKFAELYLGYRVYDEETERILPAETIEIPEDLSYSHSSPLLYRHTDWALPTELRRKWCLNGEDGIQNRIIGFCHTMGALTERSNEGQPCLSDENVYQTALKNVRKWIKDNPGCRIISVTQNDNIAYCTCPKCSALAEKENQSGVMLNFVNRLADEIAQEYPEVYLLTFAYQYTRKAPVTIKPRKNVIIWLCSIECCFSHTLDDCSCERNKEFYKDLLEWSLIADKIYVWDYTTNYSRYVAPFPDFETLRPNTAFFVKNHAVAIYEEGGYQQRQNGEFRSLRAYLEAQLLWDPFMTDEKYHAVMNDFLEGYYGAGWKNIAEYIAETCKKVRSWHMGIFFSPIDVFPDGQGNLDGDFVMRMDALWEKAIEAAQTDLQRAHCFAGSCQSKLMVASVLSLRKGPGKIDEASSKVLLNALRSVGVQLWHEGSKDSAGIALINEEMMQTKEPFNWTY